MELIQCEIRKDMNYIQLVFKDGYYYIIGVINSIHIRTFPMHKLCYAKKEYDRYVERI